MYCTENTRGTGRLQTQRKVDRRVRLSRLVYTVYTDEVLHCTPNKVLHVNQNFKKSPGKFGITQRLVKAHSQSDSMGPESLHF